MMKTLKGLVTLVLLGLVLVFAVQNMEIVNVRFLGWNLTLPRSLMVMVLLLVGFILGWIVSSSRVRIR